jgi:hypothetical protein
MAWLTDSLAQAAFKKLFGLVHTEGKSFPLGNEANPSQITIVASDVYTYPIPSTATAVANKIIACTNPTAGQVDSYLTVAQNLAIAPDGAGEGHPYLITVPAGHGLIGQKNPLTGTNYAQGDIVMSIIPKKFGGTWRPILYDGTKTEIPPLSSLDWIMDERGFIIIRDNSTAPAFLGCWVYVADTLATFAESDPTVPSHVKAISSLNITNWDSAASWGNHALAGYALSDNINLTGGTSNQVLVKKSGTDYDYQWEDLIIDPTYTKLLDDTVANTIYLGEAVPSSAESSAVWRIQKIVLDASGNVDSVRYAAGGTFNQIWNNRASLTYA